MKKIFSLCLMLLTIVLFSCTSDELASNKIGYLSLEVSSVNTTYNPDTRAIPANYNARTLYAEIVDSKGKVVESTNDHTQWTNKNFALPVGEYTINAHSAGWDGKDSGRDVPYFAGSTTVTITPNEKASAKVVCTMANVKVSATFDASVKQYFAQAHLTITSKVNGVEEQIFDMNDESLLTSVYIPAGDFTATLAVVNNAGEMHTQAYDYTNVKARDHYKFSFSTTAPAPGTGDTQLTIVVNDGVTNYTYIFTVPVKGEPAKIKSMTLGALNAWSNFIYASGMAEVEEGTLDPTKVVFQYQKANEADWQQTEATYDAQEKVFHATIKGLDSNSFYTIRMAYTDGDGFISNDVETVQTENGTPLPNGDLDNWYTASVGSKSYPFPCTEAEYTSSNGNVFWGTSNPGSATLNKVVTQGESSIVHTPGGKSAKLASTKVLTTIAAASMYVGSFGATNMTTQTATVNFGRPFDSRPSALKGWFRYSTSTIDVVGKNVPSELGIKKGETRDLWSCYWALMTEAFAFDNGNIAGTAVNWETDPRVIAYGAMPDNKCIETNDWTEFNIPLNYRTLDKPQNMVLVLVFSASKYGDYMTGCTSSVLYLDDLELVYDEPVK